MDIPPCVVGSVVGTIYRILGEIMGNSAAGRSDIPYDHSFFASQSGVSLASAELVVPYLLSLVPARSVVDVGCGVGTWLSVFAAHGVEITGFDGDYVDRRALHIPAAAFHAKDLAGDWLPPAAPRFDLAVSLEVAEHLPASSAERFVAQLCAASDAVLFSAALPTQGGTAHLNEQWPSYWIALFSQHGFRPLDVVRARFWNEPRVDLCYRNNTFVFANDAALARFAALSSAAASLPPLADVVHPERYVMVHSASRQESLSFLQLLRLLPGALRRAVSRRLGGPAAD